MGWLNDWWNNLFSPDRETKRQNVGKAFVLVSHLDVHDKLTRTGFYLYGSAEETLQRHMTRWAQNGFDFGLYWLSNDRYILRERVKEILFTREDYFIDV